MQKKLTITVEYIVTETDAQIGGNVEWLRSALDEYLTDPEWPLRADYSKDTTSGYDGVYITDARIVTTSIEDEPPFDEVAFQNARQNDPPPPFCECGAPWDPETGGYRCAR